ncbi:hypothetical protein MFUM_310049 [Methylacidiphilum fumariolicum SolV]|uniref:Uncharacterized protein n=2 Tax=Candidatus Methylacidiphilum fumarolicum TaxID=591154 RepID=I0JY08_METFB|nr:conserved protein of unknown function [Candidatus Methylacidiphilum fumarolicum]CCG92127.1 hypothetical protein MFUM_310049 [Methylacidiphilum fumariolicum SolV]
MPALPADSRDPPLAQRWILLCTHLSDALIAFWQPPHRLSSYEK